jgi:superoxide reductase
MKFYICKHCGNIVAYADYKGVPVICCGEIMQELVPGSVDASVEKHVPVVEVSGNKVTVTIGSDPHPMTVEHHIAWVSLETKEGNQRKVLDKTGKPSVDFMICDGDEVVAAYAYCNLHGLWKS